ncbi:VWA domain-containing protein [Riemerella anatipestifer]|uniref:VWA domain-containing protein n=1 Tax=Riemerella anatipestifer TaxID=34085 RepID=UPI001BDAFE1B|nr:VWA domain-containing protein [Riemerella anatipestifer]MBT0562956.1 VWA domain-containing protein [Riemerella anatipestifer]QZO85117.1 VWA domain-containing protein [Riemerella anatipestifer]
MDWYLGNYWYALLMLLLPLLGYLLFRYLKWKERVRGYFADERFQSTLFEKTKWYPKFFLVMYFVAFLFLIFAMMDLMGGKEEIKVQQKMNNVMFLVDVSNSMNAQDVAPDRLSLAKNIVISSMQKMTNDRVGLAVFAGEAFSVMPLTTDYLAAESFVSGLETSVVSTQGTDFYKAMQVAVSKFKTVSKGSGKIVLISDGEDNEGNEAAAIKEAQSNGIQVITVGLGTEEGAPIPEYIFGQLMGYKSSLMGETVISKRQTQALINISEKTGGVYINGNQIDKAVNEILENLKKQSSTTESFVKSQTGVHYYQYFLAVALLLFFIIYLTNPKRDFNI